jgi:hypothetical protein
MQNKVRGASIYAFCLIVSWTLAASDIVGAQRNSKPTPPKRVSPKRSADEDNAKEALLRYLFAKQKPDTQSKVYFLSINGTDAKADLLLRFKNNPVPVKNVSQVYYGPIHSRPVGVPFDKGTHQRGCVFELYDVRWANDDKLLMKVHVHWGGRAGYGGIYPLVRQGSKWVVKQPTAPFEE